MNRRQREKRRLALLIKIDANRSGKLPAWYWKHAREALQHRPRWPVRSKRYRQAMRRAGHAVRGGKRISFRGLARSGPGSTRMTWRQWMAWLRAKS